MNQLDHIARAVVVIAGLCFMAMVLVPTIPLIVRGETDFLPIYVATTLVGGPDLYNPDAYYLFMTNRFGSINESLVYSRLPFYAALLQPLGLLSFGHAAVVWFLYRIAAFAGFLVLTNRSSRLDTISFSAFYVPLFAALAGGQDSIVVLSSWRWLCTGRREAGILPRASRSAFVRSNPTFCCCCPYCSSCIAGTLSPWAWRSAQPSFLS